MPCSDQTLDMRRGSQRARRLTGDVIDRLVFTHPLEIGIEIGGLISPCVVAKRAKPAIRLVRPSQMDLLLQDRPAGAPEVGVGL